MLQRLAFILAIALLAYAAWPLGSVRSIDFLREIQIMVLISTITLISLMVQQKSFMPDIGLKPGILLCLAAFMVLCLAVAAHLHTAFLELAKLSAYALLFFCFYHGANRIGTRAFLLALIAIATAYSFYGFGQLKGWYDHGFWAQPELLSSRMVNSTHFAGFLLLPLMACVGMLFSSIRWPFKVLVLPGLLALSIAMLYTQSRVGWLSLSISLLLFSGWLFYAKASTVHARWKIIGILALLAVLACIAYWGRDAIATRLLSLKNSHYQSLFQRWDVWRSTLWVTIHYPLGVGGDNLALISPALKITDERFLIDYAHNEFLQWAVEYGVLGFLAIASLLCLYEYRMVKALKALRHQPGILCLHAGLFCGAQGLILESLMDFPLRIPANAFLFSATIGFQWGLLCRPTHDFKQERSDNKHRLTILAFFILGLILVGLQSTHLLAAEHLLRQADKARRMFAWDDATHYLTKNSGRLTGDERMNREFGKMLMQRSVIAKDKHATLLKAKEALQKAYRLSPSDADTVLHLAKACEVMGLREEAEGWYRLSMQINPYSRAQWDLADFLMANGMDNQGLRYLSFRNAWLEGRDLLTKLDQAYAHVQDFDRLSMLVPVNPTAWNHFSMFLEQKGDMRGVERIADRLLGFGEEGRQEMRNIINRLSAQGKDATAEVLKKSWSEKGMPLT